VKRLAAFFALSALAAATVGLAQQATQQAPTQPSAATSQTTAPPDPTSQATPPADSSSQPALPSDAGADRADKQALMKDCMTQVQAANPNVPAKDIQTYCDDQVKKIYTSQPD
jgi:hypothetical protein